ncbi:dihydrofolate reductase family protein [Homoserinibacter gongjuensis]|uniref:Bacterial bifunctional deaminase-reductase C-terminal domain-containing protein n=1 Tax=Homoserinibacter gongjuensis TaxID=1162968 RepID=A0ABQ6JVM5_9MICO|nr:hypothetical protein [Homoserinibacter gongjuensis]GMA91325.1 hypothetical protein GCM10025869_18540 [Homoserinibacter gongjuensis]
MRELIYYVAVSMDGYIAGPDGQFDAFLMEGDHMQGINEGYADTIPTAFAASLGLDQSGGRFDAVLMGSATWGVGLPDHPSPYGHLAQYVFTHRPQQPVEGSPSPTVTPSRSCGNSRSSPARTSGCAEAVGSRGS